MRTKLLCLLTLGVIAATAVPALADPALAENGPTLELPDTPALPTKAAEETAPATVLGGYGQLSANWRKIGPIAPPEGRASVRRLVLFLTHQFDDRFRVTTEFEWENAIACSTCQGLVEVEQAYVDWRILGDTMAMRAGLLLVPMGIINQNHEPSVFHGVERPLVDEVVIPTTWRELGAGIFGKLRPDLRYELYVVTAPDPLKLTREGLADSRGLGSAAVSDGPALTGRIEYEPVLGLLVGASGFAGEMGSNALFYDKGGERVHLSLPLIGYTADARYKRGGLEARLVFAQFHLPESGTLMKAYRDDGSPQFPDPANTGAVPTRIEGGYVEVAYDVLRLLTETDHQLLPFVRLEYADTQAAVPAGMKSDPRFTIQEATYGLTYRPISQVVFKADYQIRDRSLGEDEWLANVGAGFMF